MNELERYLFDLQGFLVIEDALLPNQVAGFNALLDEMVNVHNQAEKPWSRFDFLLGCGQPITQT